MVKIKQAKGTLKVYKMWPVLLSCPITYTTLDPSPDSPARFSAVRVDVIS